MPKKELKHQPWYQRPDETFLTYGLFRVYLEMGFERSLIKVQEETGRKYAVIAQLSGKFKWNQRATAYDDHVRELQEKAAEKKLQKEAIIYAEKRSVYRDREHTLAEALLIQAQQMLNAPLYETVINKTQIVNGEEVPLNITLKPAGWNKVTAIKMARTASEIMRLNLEMETSRIGVVNLDDPNERLRLARASLEKHTKDIDQLVDLQMSVDPTLDRQEVTQEVLKKLPEWCAADWKLSADQMPLLTEGIYIKPISEDSLPMPEPENDLPM